MSVCLGCSGTRTSRYLARFYDQKIHTGRKIRLGQVRWSLNILYWLQIHLPPLLPLGVQDHLGPFWGSLLSLHRSQRPLTKPWASGQEPAKLKGNGSILHPPANQGNSEHPALAPHLTAGWNITLCLGPKPLALIASSRLQYLPNATQSLINAMTSVYSNVPERSQVIVWGHSIQTIAKRTGTQKLQCKWRCHELLE